MKIKQRLSRLLMALLLVVAHIPLGGMVAAQETVDVAINVFLQIQGGEPNAQPQVSYDILNEAKTEFLWSYRSNEPPQETLTLAPGNYVFRLYDGGDFIREGAEIAPDKVEQSIAQLSDDDIANNRTKTEVSNVGEVLAQGDGSRVYDLPFTVLAGPDLPNGNTSELDIYLSDGTSQSEESSNEETPAVPESETSQVNITAVDENGQPISQVMIQLGDQQVATNEQGLAQFKDIVAGDYMVTIASMPEGYEGELSDMVLVEPGQPLDITLNLSTAAPAVGTLAFKVLDQNEAPVSGVVIQVNETELTTNETGDASLSELPIGDYEYSIVALPEGYSGEIWSAVGITADETTTQTLTITKDAPQLGAANFTVIDQNGSAVNGATLTVNDQQITTNEAGVASLADLPVGTYGYSIASLPEGYTGEASGEVAVTTEGAEPVTITVERAPQLGAVNFTVIDQNGSAVNGATLTVNDQQITTNEAGVASLADLPVGTYPYSIAALPEGYTGETSGEVAVTTEGAEPVTITVERAPQLGSASFTVVDQNGSAVNGATLTVNDQQITTNEAGVASLADFPVGTYPYSIASLPEGYTGDASGEVSVTTEGAEPVTITVERAPQLGSASFTVVDQNGSVVNGATLTVNDQQITTNEAGIASLVDLPVGTYPYSIASLPEGYKGEASGEVAVTTQGAEPVTITVERAPQLGSAIFTVVDQNGSVVNGATLTVNDQQITTNEAGVASLADLPIGEQTYTVTSLPDGYSGEASGTITITVGEVIETKIDITKDTQYGDITFNVTDQQDKPVVGAVIRMNERDFTTNSDGQAIILELETGKDFNYQLASLPEGYNGQAQGVVKATANETVTQDLKVEREIAKARLTIRIMDQTDRPVAGAVVQLDGAMNATTDAEGNAIFSELNPKTYSYMITTLPENYSHEITAQEISISEGADESITLNVNRKITQRGVSIRVLDQEDKPVEGATIVLNEQTQTTDAEGRVVFSNLNPQVYTYEITALPEGYQGATQGEVELTEEKDAAIDVWVSREIKPGTAILTVVDQDNQPVHDATVKFGGLSQATDSEGQTAFSALEPGEYYYEVTEAPAGYSLTDSNEEKHVKIEEAMDFSETLTIERNPEVGNATIKVVNDAQQPIAEVTVKLGEHEVVTNAEGVATFEKLAPGDYPFEVIKAPADYLIATVDASLTVVGNETVTQTISLQTKPVESESESESSSESSSESQESEPDESETEAATQRYVDDATGVEVWVNPADAGNVVKLEVNRITETLDPMPAALEGQKKDVFELKLLDRNNDPVNLTRVAQVKLPTQPVTSQLRVVRVEGGNTSNLTFSLHNQKVNFSTQALGKFAILYGPQRESSSEASSSDTQSESSQSSSISVSKSTDVESAEGDLPATGEIRQVWSIVGAILLLLVGVMMIIRRKKTE